MQYFKITTTLVLLALLSISAKSFSATHNVQVSGLTFTPAILNIEAGDTVIFTNVSGFHNVKADDGSFRCSTDCEVTPNDGGGALSSAAWVAEITFNSIGSFNYFCEAHGGVGGAGMSGVINVIAPTATVHEIRSDGFTFTPDDITIAPGDIVNFINDQGVHNVRADDDSFECSDGCLDTGKNLSSEPSSTNWSVFVTFDALGDVPYYCEQHGGTGGSGMSGIVRVSSSDTIFINGFE
ncbi:UDP-N-acetylmuramate--alanine ligase [hydrothermal vent metagenome]|uniref:UDP-N-acetylmuramate--alanine ligase n=1 Tax=hydrothermal vent metagenome TaxID=652676 RepID=A0A3B0VW43_9ZZZZ